MSIPLTAKNQIRKMIRIVVTAHEMQEDKAGDPYILHCMRVMMGVKNGDLELKAIAVGHDLLEDTDWTSADLERSGFSPRVVKGIVALTKVKGQSPKEYLRAVLSNEDACQVKLIDLDHNKDLLRLPQRTEKDFLRQIKYEKMSIAVLTMLDWYNKYRDNPLQAHMVPMKVEEVVSECGL